MTEKKSATPQGSANTRTSVLYQKAHNFASTGWGVFPVAESTKAPASKHGCKDATTDRKRIETAWTKRPDLNIGIATGKVSSLLVIDLDRNHSEADGMATLREWEQAHEKLPETACAITPKGGKHLYYSCDEDIRCSANGKIGVDIRANGGYVVAPPSQTPDGEYVWERAPEKGVAQANSTVLEFVHYVQGNNSGDAPDQDKIPFEMPDKLIEGERHDKLFRYASSLQARGYSDSEIAEQVIEANFTKCTPPLSLDEVENNILVSATNYKKGKPKVTTTPIKSLDVLSYDAELAKQTKPEVIEGVLREGTVALMAAPSKAGKTFLMAELAIACATGGKWLGWQCTQGDVLVLDGEMLMPDLWQRYEAIIKDLSLKIGDVMSHIKFVPLRGLATNLATLAEPIIEAASEGSYRLLLLDPSYVLVSGDENSASDIRDFTNQILKIAEETGCAVVYSGHHAKGALGDRFSIDRVSGSGVWARSADAIIDLIELIPSDEQEAQTSQSDKDIPAFRVSTTIRNFKPRDDFDVWFKYPRHIVDATGALAEWEPMTSSRAGGKSSGRRASKAKESRKHRLEDILSEMIEASSEHRIQKKELSPRLAEIGIKETTLNKYIDELPNFRRVTEGGNICYIEPMSR